MLVYSEYDQRNFHASETGKNSFEQGRETGEMSRCSVGSSNKNTKRGFFFKELPNR